MQVTLTLKRGMGSAWFDERREKVGMTKWARDSAVAGFCVQLHQSKVTRSAFASSQSKVPQQQSNNTAHTNIFYKPSRLKGHNVEWALLPLNLEHETPLRKTYSGV